MQLVSHISQQLIISEDEIVLRLSFLIFLWVAAVFLVV